MKLLIKTIILLLVCSNLSFSATKAEDEISKQLKNLEKVIGTSFKAISGKGLGKKETEKFLLEYVLILQDERGDGEVTYLFNESEYVRYKNYEEISSGAWRFTKTGKLRIFNDDVKLTWKIKLGKENKINIKTKYDPIGKLYKFKYKIKSVYITELIDFRKKKQEDKERLEQEKLDAQRKAEEEKKRLEQEKLDAQRKAEEEKQRLEQEKLDAQRKAEEEKQRLEQEKLDAQRKAEEEKKRLEQEKLDTERKAEVEKARLEKEIAEQKRILEKEKQRLEQEKLDAQRKAEV